MKTFPIREISPDSSDPKISKVFRIRKVEALLNGNDMQQDTHRHNFFFVLALKEGHGTHVIDFTKYVIENNCIFLMRPGQVHQLSLSASSSGYLMEFNLEFFHLSDRNSSQQLRRATTTNFCKLEIASFNNLYTILENIHQEFTEARDGYDEVIRAQIDIFFVHFSRHRQTLLDTKKGASTYEQERLDEFRELIEENISSKKQVSDYADMLNVTSYQLSAITKAVVGKTPSELINEYIILESKRYLLSTSHQVNQIAGALGYDDASYFIRFFKKHTGYSPEAFRSKGI